MIINSKLLSLYSILIVIKGDDSCIERWDDDYRFVFPAVSPRRSVYNDHDLSVYKTIKIGTVGDNLAISCLVDDKNDQYDLFQLHKKYKWLYYKFNTRPRLAWTELAPVERGKYSNSEVNYTVGKCFELIVVKIDLETRGIFKCVRKDNKTKTEIEIIVDVEPKAEIDESGCVKKSQMDLKLDRKALNLLIATGLHSLFTMWNPWNSYEFISDNIKDEYFEHKVFYVYQPALVWHEILGQCLPCIYNETSTNGTRKSVSKLMLVGSVFYYKCEKPSTIQCRDMVKNSVDLQNIDSIKVADLIGLRTILGEIDESNWKYIDMDRYQKVREQVDKLKGYKDCVTYKDCVPETCPSEIASVTMDKINLGDLKKRLKVRVRRPKLELRPDQFQNFETLHADESFEIELSCLPLAIDQDDEVLASDDSVTWYQCIESCKKIRGFTFLRFVVSNKNNGTLKIRKIELRDTAIYVCTQFHQIRGVIRLQVFSSTAIFDIRTPVGSMFMSTILISGLYFIFIPFRLGLFKYLVKLFRKLRLRKRGYKPIEKVNKKVTKGQKKGKIKKDVMEKKDVV
ncbi:uncharacterized protein LOC128388857 [Panonychus citri]|uniref:uncharacterized protein LOC128388857 n=1 Tax=Panonychus citri TaxID=50023 RepID=UPI0023082639|nr:uncharacterized protein LOC128388857 [Panonychus citri]